MPKLSKKYTPKTTKQKAKVAKVMEEFRSGSLHSGKKTGKKVTSRPQAIAIALSESSKMGKKRKKA
jgi:hypothetical protein